MLDVVTLMSLGKALSELYAPILNEPPPRRSALLMVLIPEDCPLTAA